MFNHVEPITSIVESITSRGITNRNWGQTIQDFPLSPHITVFTWRWVSHEHGVWVQRQIEILIAASDKILVGVS